jgi:hypothetical protein
MSSPLARAGRRRRVLNEEVRIAAGTTTSPVACEDPRDSEPAPRYGEQANIENHPQITDYVPRRPRAVLLTIAGGLGVAILGESVCQNSESLAASVTGLTAATVRDQFAQGMIAWTSAVMFLLGAALARIIYNLRRHRVDDYRGSYRVWRWAAAGLVVLSVNAVVQSQLVAAPLLASLTGFHWTPKGTEWLLIPLMVVGGGIGALITRDAAESRGSLVLAALAWCCYAAAAAAALGWSASGLLGSWNEALVRSLPLVGHTFALTALTLFARYVVLDVQGLIDHSRSAEGARPRRDEATARAVILDEVREVSEATQSNSPNSSDADGEQDEAVAGSWQSAAQQRHRERDSHGYESQDANIWVDGSQPEEDDGDDPPRDRKLTKAERKRLRKQKASRRAA